MASKGAGCVFQSKWAVTAPENLYPHSAPAHIKPGKEVCGKIIYCNDHFVTGGQLQSRGNNTDALGCAARQRDLVCVTAYDSCKKITHAPRKIKIFVGVHPFRVALLLNCLMATSHRSKGKDSLVSAIEIRRLAKIGKIASIVCHGL